MVSAASDWAASRPLLRGKVLDEGGVIASFIHFLELGCGRFKLDPWRMPNLNLPLK